ncbi:hypothetical protein RVR_5468 [Actinacidiphila reveromycinica]|uniref:Uncharacterized protein n=1 Tax=Actinacidiphila reveromycinica TaxID=659352 RepID=A0A7U3UUS7_9ACTN|nr:hypothetical protein [Streptomyces sp. SN-593]BBA99018.1 hypothetical protein RVR_5468 [Streptomyces sp. SN-593]
MTDETVAANDPVEENTVPGWHPDLWTLPRLAAVDNLAEALLRHGLTEGGARAMSRAAVRPDDMRRRLADPAELRVQGGTLLIAETRLWSAAVLPHPANPREYGHRQYALGSSGTRRRVMTEPGSAPSGVAELEMRVETPTVIAQRLEDAKGRLIKDNPLAQDIAVEGVLQPLTVVSLTVAHENGHPDRALLIAADGSSRISAAHELLDYSPSRIAYEWGADDRKIRSEISRWTRLIRRQGWEELTEDERCKVRTLSIPARVVIGFRPNAQAGQAFHTAVRNFIGLTHIRPPRPYGPAVENEAKADAVLDSLAEPSRSGDAHITELEKHWYAGNISQEEAKSAGLSGHRDVRAAEIVRSLLGGGVRTARRVNGGIRSLTAKQRPKRDERIDVAVELILRPVRTALSDSAMDDAKFLRPRRAVLQRAYRLPEIEDLSAEAPMEGAETDGCTLEELRDAAMAEASQGLGDSGRLGPAQSELAVKAAYHMAMAEPMALQREVFGGNDDDDDRGAATVLRAMLSRRRGIAQAYEVIRAGRRGERLREVEEDGELLITAEGRPRELTDALVRHTYSGGPMPLEDARVGFKAASVSWACVRESVDRLRKDVSGMANVPVEDDGPSFVIQEGWEPAQVREVRDILDRVSRRVAAWADRFEERAETAEL